MGLRCAQDPASLTSAAPVQRPFFPKVHVTRQHYGDEQEHLHETKPLQFLVHDRPRVQENHFHIEQNKDHADQVEADRESMPCVTDGSDSTLIWGKLLARGPLDTYPGRQTDDHSGEQTNNRQMNQNRQVTCKHFNKLRDFQSPFSCNSEYESPTERVKFFLVCSGESGYHFCSKVVGPARSCAC